MQIVYEVQQYATLQIVVGHSCGVLEAESCTSFRIGLELSFATGADSSANKPLRIN